MSLNITVAKYDFIACGTDRRVTRADGRILSERLMKLTAFQCADARGFITFNGIGCDSKGITPNDWLREISDIGMLSLFGFAQRIKEISKSKIQGVAHEFADNPRHTFVIGAFHGERPVVGLISNYESFDAPDEELARSTLDVQFVAARDRNSSCVLATGDIGRAKATMRKELATRVKTGAPPKTVVRWIKKTIRDASYAKNRRGTVGTSVAVGLMTRIGDTTVGVSMPSGSTIHEIPNAILPGASFADAWISGGSAEFNGRRPGEGRLREVPCSNCRSPVPEGYRQCGVCGHSIS